MIHKAMSVKYQLLLGSKGIINNRFETCLHTHSKNRTFIWLFSEEIHVFCVCKLEEPV